MLFKITGILIFMGLGITLGPAPLIAIACAHFALKSFSEKGCEVGEEFNFEFTKIDGSSKTEAGKAIFGGLLDSYPATVIGLTKELIQSSDKRDINILMYLIEELDEEKLIRVLNYLNHDEISIWKKLLSRKDKNQLPLTVDHSLAQKLCRHLLVRPSDESFRFLNLLARVPRKKFEQFIVRETFYGSTLFHVVSSKFMNEICQNLDTEVFDRMLKQSLSTSEKSVEPLVEELVLKLEVYINRQNGNNLIEQFVSMLEEADPSQERSLFEGIAEKSNRQFLLTTARTMIPSEIIEALPRDIIREALNNMSFKERGEYIYGQVKAKREYLIDTFSLPGTRSRDLIEKEMNRLDSDWDSQCDINRRMRKIKKSFVNSVRYVVAANEEHKMRVYPLVDRWANKILEKTNAIEQINIEL